MFIRGRCEKPDEYFLTSLEKEELRRDIQKAIEEGGVYFNDALSSTHRDNTLIYTDMVKSDIYDASFEPIGVLTGMSANLLRVLSGKVKSVRTVNSWKRTGCEPWCEHYNVYRLEKILELL